MLNLSLRIFFFFLIVACPFSITGNELEEFPVLFKGRFRPVEAYAKLWFYDLYHSSTIKSNALKEFKTPSSSPLPFLWELNFLGSSSYQDIPLFWIQSGELKKWLGLTPTQDRFSYGELRGSFNFLQIHHELKKELEKKDKKFVEEWSSLNHSLKEFEQLKGIFSPSENAYRNRLKELQESGVFPKEIGKILEREFPLAQRLGNAGSLFKSLPSRYQEGDWFSLNALKVHLYQPSSQSLQEIGNFTSYSDEDFYNIRATYLRLHQAYLSSNQEEILSTQQQLAFALSHAYKSIAGNIVHEAHEKKMVYPSTTQLKIESLYVHYPWIPLLILLYGIGAALLFVGHQKNFPRIQFISKAVIFFAVVCHSSLLVMRSYILGRPPVSNMFETVIYVPWIGACAALLFPAFRKHSLVLLAACICSIVLLILLQMTDLNQSLDQVQAVLDSQFWLFIHVLLVVGSYGMFILGGMIGHFYLILFLIHRKETETMKQLASMILQSMYAGTTLLISGTILGGIWAAESWGRFWDWDPKESWAFISSCYYLIWIHAYRFHRISSFGLAVGAVSGLFAITFTWYGVNYILGTGLHSYGFGSGGEHYYYAYLIAESLFLAIVLVAMRLNVKVPKF